MDRQTLATAYLPCLPRRLHMKLSIPARPLETFVFAALWGLKTALGMEPGKLDS